MKTPDEIKKYAQTWREVLVDDCVDFPYAVHTMLHTAAGLVESLLTEIEQVKRERDAAVGDLEAARTCQTCGYYELQGYDCMRCSNSVSHPHWKWRGPEVE